MQALTQGGRFGACTYIIHNNKEKVQLTSSNTNQVKLSCQFLCWGNKSRIIANFWWTSRNNFATKFYNCNVGHLKNITIVQNPIELTYLWITVSNPSFKETHSYVVIWDLNLEFLWTKLFWNLYLLKNWILTTVIR